MRRRLFLLAVVTCCLGFGSVCTANLEIQSSGPIFVLEAEVPYPDLSLVVVGDLTGDGRPEIILAADSEVVVLDQLLQPITSYMFSAPITALDVGEIDGYPALIVGSSGPGTVHYLRLQGDRLYQVSRTGYLWSRISFVAVANITGLYGDDLVTITENGQLILFTWDGKSFRSVVEDTLPFTPKQVTVGNLGNTPEEELIIARDNWLQVLTFTDGAFVPVWDNYAWGNITHISVLPGKQPSQLVVGTTEQIIQTYLYQGGRFQLQSHCFGENLSLRGFSPCELGLGQFTVVGYADDRNPVLLRASGNQMIDLWTNRNTGFTIRGVYSIGEDTLVISTDDTVQIWRKRPVNFHTIFLNGVSYQTQYPGLVAYDTIYLSLTDIGHLVGIDFSFVEPEPVVKVPYWHQFLTLYEGVWQVFVGPKTIPLDGPVLHYDGQVYLPASSLEQIFGLSVNWDHSRRILRIERDTLRLDADSSEG